MKKGSYLTYALLPAVILLLLLYSCHSSKKAAKHQTLTSGGTTYTTEQGNPPSTKKQRKSKQPKEAATEAPPRDNAIAAKYADKLGVSKREITNYNLYNFVDSWYATPYKYAGRTHSGVDCSDLVSLLFQSVYNVSVSGNVTDIYRRCTPIKPSELREGDLIFFKINSKSLSHVGIYLQNNKFVHASVHSGVVIDDLSEDYYKRYFWGAGRLLK